jgi:hypothetical protein
MPRSAHCPLCQAFNVPQAAACYLCGERMGRCRGVLRSAVTALVALLGALFGGEAG